MLGIPVYQVYGLTETTAIVTMDRPPEVIAGRVGPAIEGVELRVSDTGELQVRGPNVFWGYHNRPEATEAAFEDGWFRTGDRAELVDGTWRILGRVKNLLVPSSGHNVAPEPIEQKLVEGIQGVEQAVVVGHGRPFLGAILTGTLDADAIDASVEQINQDLPHYRRIRRVHVSAEPFSVENGLLTANRKLRRGVIEAHYADQVEAFYA
jgi:long-chain acyl-CoA synthetase